LDGVNGLGNNTSLADLVSDLNAALAAAGMNSSIEAVAMGNRVAFIPTAQSSVNSIQIAANASDTAGTLASLNFKNEDVAGQAILIGAADAPSDGRVNTDLVFTVSVSNSPNVTITVPASLTNGDDGAANQTIDDLVADLNTAIKDIGLDMILRA
jgi:hypothetical protein